MKPNWLQTKQFFIIVLVKYDCKWVNYNYNEPTQYYRLVIYVYYGKSLYDYC